MMTVKHIDNSGSEFIYPATQANYVPAPNQVPAGQEFAPSTLWVYDEAKGIHPLTGGTAYVMNEHGKTVARYDMGVADAPVAIAQPRT